MASALFPLFLPLLAIAVTILDLPPQELGTKLGFAVWVWMLIFSKLMPARSKYEFFILFLII